MSIFMSSDPEKRARHPSVGELAVTSVLSRNEAPIFEGEYSADDETLAALGYKSEFKREFSLWTTFCVSFAVLGLLPSFASTLYFGMGYAGTAGMIWGWLIAMVFIQCVAFGMAEICSSMPTSGGLYYASAVLAPPGWGPLAAWITGWSNFLVQVTGAPSVDYALSAMVLAAVSINVPDYTPQDYHTFLLTTLVMILHACISSMPTKWIANFNSVGSTFNIIALIVVIIIIPAATNRESQDIPRFTASSDAWGTIYNGTEFPPGIAILMSFLSVIWTMSGKVFLVYGCNLTVIGYDAPFHLSEECSNASVAAPRAIVLTSAIGGLFGWFLQLVVAYTVVDIEGVITSDLGQPWAAYLLQVLPVPVTNAVLALTIVCAFSMGQGCMVAASRVTFAYARDGCFPCSWWISRVNKTTNTPVNAVWFNCAVGVLLTLLIFGGPVAIGAIFSIGALAAFVAFTIPIFIKTFLVGDRFRPGPWNLGRFSRPIGAAACSFVLLMVPILCFPSVVGSDLSPELMNWTCLVYGAPMLGVLLWWAIDARKWFKGPKVNIDHLMIGRKAEDVGAVNGEIINGQETRSTQGIHELGRQDSSSGSGTGSDEKDLKVTTV